MGSNDGLRTSFAYCGLASLMRYIMSMDFFVGHELLLSGFDVLSLKKSFHYPWMTNILLKNQRCTIAENAQFKGRITFDKSTLKQECICFP